MSNITRRALAGVVFAALAVTAAVPALAQSRTGGTPNSMYAGIGLKGYDPVSYFTDDKAAVGNPEINAFDGQLTWHFTSEEHKAAFEADPKRYQPQFGGYCSWGVANGKLFEVDPENGWTVVDDKLYVNFNADINALFAADTAAFIAKAEANWPTLNQ
jgi:YHS domain-containing protein